MSTQGMSLEQANDFMALETPLVELVNQAVAGMSPAVHVLTAADLGEVRESAQHTPAVHVIYGGYQVAEAAGTQWRLLHRWYVVAAVRNVAQARSGQAARRGAGALAARVTAALAGSSLSGATKPLELITPPPARYSAGFSYIPSAFQVETIFRKPQRQ